MPLFDHVKCARGIALVPDASVCSVNWIQAALKCLSGMLRYLCTDCQDDEFEKRIRPHVVKAGSINVSFDSIGSLDDVKATLSHLVITPLKHPKLFSSHGLLQVNTEQ